MNFDPTFPPKTGRHNLPFLPHSGHAKVSLEVFIFETIQNPYYGGKVDTNESESVITSRAMRNSLRENIKVTNNIYYDQ